MKRSFSVLLIFSVMLLTFALSGCKNRVSGIKDITDLSEFYRQPQTASVTATDLSVATGADSIKRFSNGVAVFRKGQNNLGVIIDKGFSLEAQEISVLEYKFNQRRFGGLIADSGAGYDFYDANGKKFATADTSYYNQTLNLLYIENTYYKIDAQGGITKAEGGRYYQSSAISNGYHVVQADGRYYCRANNDYGDLGNVLSVFDEQLRLVNSITWHSSKGLNWFVLDNGKVLMQYITHLEAVSDDFSYITQTGDKYKVETTIWDPFENKEEDLGFKFRVLQICNAKVTTSFNYASVFTEKAPNYLLVAPFDSGEYYEQTNKADITAVILSNEGEPIAKSKYILQEVYYNYSQLNRISALGDGKWLIKDSSDINRIVDNNLNTLNGYRGGIYYKNFVHVNDKIYQGDTLIYTLISNYNQRIEACDDNSVIIYSNENGESVYYKVSASGKEKIGQVRAIDGGYVVTEDGKYTVYINGQSVLTSEASPIVWSFEGSMLIKYTQNSTNYFKIIK